MTSIIKRNTVIPRKEQKIFSTAVDNQDTVTIKVYEGERPMTKDNHLLGSFDLTGIPPASRGVPQIEVTFQVDANGIMQVTAKDKGTQQGKSITITNDNDRLTPEEIQRMLDEAVKYEAEDKLVKEHSEAKNELEQYAWSLKKQVDELKIEEEQREDILKIVEEKLEWLHDNENQASTDELKEAKKAIEEIAQPIIAKLYQQNQQEPEPDLDNEEL